MLIHAFNVYSALTSNSAKTADTCNIDNCGIWCQGIEKPYHPNYFLDNIIWSSRTIYCWILTCKAAGSDFCKSSKTIKSIITTLISSSLICTVYRVIQKIVTILLACHSHNCWPRRLCFGHVPYIYRFYFTNIQAKRCNGFLAGEESQNCLILVQEQTVVKVSSNLRRVWHGISWSFAVPLHFEECEPFRYHGH